MFKKLIAILLTLVMVFALAACGKKEKDPSSKAGTEAQQALTKQGYDLLVEKYADALKQYSVEFSPTVFMMENETPQGYGISEENPLYENVKARALYVWVIQSTVPMYSMVFFMEDGTLDYYTYMYDDTAKAAAETRAAQDAYYEVMEDKLVEFYYNQYLQMNEALIPLTEEALEGWEQLDISHLL